MRKMLFFVLCAGLLSSVPATAQQAIPPAGYKDPGTATILSVVITGGGQLYSGDTRKGVMLLGIGMGGVTLGYTLAIQSGSAAPALLGYAAYLGSWIYGIMDASDSAQRMNAKNGLAGVLPANVSPVVSLDRSGGTQVGVSVRF